MTFLQPNPMMSNFKTKLQFATQRQWALGLMLLTLHGLLLSGFGTPIEKALLICHYGLFLMWQPIWKAQEKLSKSVALLFLSAGALLIFFANWWIIAFWLCALFGLLGGRVVSAHAKSTRIGYLLAASYLLAVLLLWVVPKLLNNSPDVATEFVMQFLLPILPIAILFTRSEVEASDHPPILDFFYTLLLLLSAIILVLGSYAIQTSSEANYAQSILKVLFGLALALLAISWLWNPRGGFSGIGQLLSRYFLSVGLPFEQWVKTIAELAENESSPKEFMLSAMREVAALPWVSGVTWDTEDSRGEIGAVAKHQATLAFHDLHLTLYTRWPLTPALTIHVKLLAQILGEFYEAKRREETLRQNIYMQAVYETGARLTHDIKNLVQSMSALCSAAEQSTDEDSERLLALLRRQLPILNQRLAVTLGKLQAPRSEDSRWVRADAWWMALQQRYADSAVEFIATEMPQLEIDTELMDSVVDNLLQNAVEKAKNDAYMTISVAINAENTFCLEVFDSGKAMPQAKAEQLFKRHVSSENGLGIGLYHAGRQAQQAGYRLSLMENHDGAVRFCLTLDEPRTERRKT